MAPSGSKQLHWVRQVQVPALTSAGFGTAAPRERLVAALADRPRTVAQLAHAFGVSQPTVLEQIRRALRDGLIVEIDVPEDEKRFRGERYYAPTVPVVRQTDRELLESACRGVAGQIADTLARNWGDVQAAFALTQLAQEGWEFDDLLPYLQETIARLVAVQIDRPAHPGTLQPHGLAWVEEVAELDVIPVESVHEESVA